MTSKLKKSTLSLFLAVMIIFTFIPSAVFASETEDLVSRDKLVTIVTEAVDKMDYKPFGIDFITSTINNIVEANVKKAVNEALTTENIKILLKDAIKEEIKSNPGKYDIPEYIDIDRAVDLVVEGRVFNVLLTNKLSKKIIDRTKEYAVNDILAEIRIPTPEEVIAAARNELIEKNVEEIYNADNKENDYYSYKLELQGFKIVKILKGWDEGAVSKKVKSDAKAVISEKCKLQDLDGVDYEGIVKESAKRAAKDVVIEELNSAGSTIINSLKDVVNKVINKGNK